ncbi:MAG: rhomboid family intramembrane serine protease [Hyphomicrobiaceae bacterium]|nr:MAG: rhomboid family intramembrane serine protease [Hyphomicrobiaceae bacterium]
MRPKSEEREDRGPRGAPWVVIVLIGLLVAVHLFITLHSEKEAEFLSQAMAFIPMRYDAGAFAAPGGSLAMALSPLTYMLVHADWTHLGVNAVWLLIFGTMVARRTGTVRFLALTLMTGVAGILLFWPLHVGDDSIVVGISGAVSGLMAGGVRLIHAASREGRGLAFMLAPEGAVPRLSETLAHAPSQVVIGIWLLLNVAIAVAARVFTSDLAIAWEVHLGGFLLGLLAFPFFDRPLPRRAVASERQQEKNVSDV